MFKAVLSKSTFAFIRLLELPFSFLSALAKSSYQVIIPASTYAPWRQDRQFRQLFKKVKRHSLVNKYQGWELWKIVEQVHKIPGDVLEVGVWRGSTSIIMGRQLQTISPGKTLFACDTFEGVAKAAHPFDNYYKGGEHSNTSQQLTARLIALQGLNNIQLLKGIFPDDTGHFIADRRFCLCHIDVDAYASGQSVLDWIWPRLNIGGMIIFNDYGFPLTKGITRLFNEQYPKEDGMLIHNLNGNGIIIKIK